MTHCWGSLQSKWEGSRLHFVRFISKTWCSDSYNLWYSPAGGKADWLADSRIILTSPPLFPRSVPSVGWIEQRGSEQGLHDKLTLLPLCGECMVSLIRISSQEAAPILRYTIILHITRKGKMLPVRLWHILVCNLILMTNERQENSIAKLPKF